MPFDIEVHGVPTIFYHYCLIFLYGVLLILFVVLFGIPSIQKYQRKETIVISSRKLTNGIAAPAVTFIALSNDTRYGWKSKTNQTSFKNGRYTNTFLIDHCKEINQTDIEAYIHVDSFGLTDFLRRIRSKQQLLQAS